ncbi:hypothetical protein J6590_035992 [Homalodisca vitripennis]|nr:hypothetical protein J6590_035992 [Homalodisca vitripennis]
MLKCRGKTRKYNKATHQLNGRRDSAITFYIDEILLYANLVISRSKMSNNDSCLGVVGIIPKYRKFKSKPLLRPELVSDPQWSIQTTMLVQGEVEAMEDTGVEVLVGEDTVREVTTRAVPITIPSLPHSRAGLGNKATVLPVVAATKLTARLRKELTNMTKEASLTIPNLHLPVVAVAQPIVAMAAKEAITVAMGDTAIRVGVVTVAEVTIKEAAAVVTTKAVVVVGATTKVAVAMAVKEVGEATIKEVVVEAMEEVVAMKEVVEVAAAADISKLQISVVK